MERYYYASDEALKEMECAYEYRCRECGSLFWGHLHGLGDIDKVQCPLCGITGVIKSGGGVSILKRMRASVSTHRCRLWNS